VPPGFCNKRFCCDLTHMQDSAIHRAQNKSPPDELPTCEDLRCQLEKSFHGFQDACRSEPVGACAPWVRFPRGGRLIWERVKSLSTCPSLTKSVREIAFLVTATRCRRGYEIHAYAIATRLTGASEERIEAIASGHCPPGLTGLEVTAFDVAWSLVSSGVLPRATYQQAADLLGEGGTAALVQLIACYCTAPIWIGGSDLTEGPVGPPCKTSDARESTRA
jgi:4-carboxymuconolactone decarboxylase